MSNDNLESALPPGGLPSDVADDVDIKASQGEFIIPANVVRFIGLDKLRSMVEKAETKLTEMEATDTVGGGEDEEGLPTFAQGGLVTAPTPTPQDQLAQAGFGGMKTYTDASGRSLKIPIINGQPAIPVPMGFTENNSAQAQVSAAPGQTQQAFGGDSKNAEDRGGQGIKGMAGSVDQWSAQDFSNYGKQKGTAVEGFGYGVVQALGGPIGKGLVQNRQDYLATEAPKALEKMLASNVDINGTPLSNQQRAELESVRESLATQNAEKPGPLAGVKEAITAPIKSAVAGFWDSLVGNSGSSFNSSSAGVNYNNVGNSRTGAFSSRTAIGSAAPQRSTGDGTGGSYGGHSADKSAPSRSDAGTSATGSKGDKNDPRG